MTEVTVQNTAQNTAQTFHPELEAIFDEAAHYAVPVTNAGKDTFVVSAESFDDMIEQSALSADDVKHTRVTRPEGKNDVVIMPSSALADLLDATQVVSEVTGDAIRLAFDG